MNKITADSIKRCMWIAPVFTTVLLVLMRVEGCSAIEAVGTLLGGRRLRFLFAKGAYVVYIASLQYMNWEFFSFWIKDRGMLLTRYQEKTKMYAVLICRLLLAGLLFILMIGLAAAAAIQIQEHAFPAAPVAGKLLLLLLQGYVEGILLSGLQILLLIKTREMTAYLVLTVYAAVVVLLSDTSLGPVLLYFLPWNRDMKWSVFCIVISLCTAGILLRIGRKEFTKRDEIEP